MTQILDTPTMRETIESILELREITDNIRADVTLTDAEKQELIDNILIAR